VGGIVGGGRLWLWEVGASLLRACVAELYSLWLVCGRVGRGE
jgi:hypothetical protein